MHCCKIGCDKEATYEIRDGSGYEDYVHSCLEHIPDLMTDAPHHEITSLPGRPLRHCPTPAAREGALEEGRNQEPDSGNHREMEERERINQDYRDEELRRYEECERKPKL